MIDYIEEKTVVQIPVLVKLVPGTRVDDSGFVPMYADATGNNWYTCRGAEARGLITVERITPSEVRA